MLVTQSHLALCDPVDCSPSGSSVHGILQARILEGVAFPFSWIKMNELLNSKCKGPKISTCLAYSRRRQWHPTPVLLPGKFHGCRSLMGYSPQGRKESDTTERLHFTSTILAWRIPWTEEPGGLQSMRPQRVGHDWVTNTFHFDFHAATLLSSNYILKHISKKTENLCYKSICTWISIGTL